MVVSSTNTSSSNSRPISANVLETVFEQCKSNVNQTDVVPDYDKIQIPFDGELTNEAWVFDLSATKQRNTAILDSIVDAIGQTPMVRLRNIEKDFGLNCELVAKCEFLNPGGSVKDRIARMMCQWEREHDRLHPNDLLIEATSGNTGIGLAMVAASSGYRLAVTMPHKMSAEKARILEALGAQVVRTRTTAAWNDSDSHIGVAYQLKQLLGGLGTKCVVLDQYKHPGNPWAHYYGTGAEIVAQTDGKMDAVVVGAGTGGTLTGIAKAVKAKLPNCRVIGVDPVGSIVRYGEHWKEHIDEVAPYQVEGVGYDFMPCSMKCELVDEWLDIGDRESFLRARDLVAKEGLLVGGSSGTALAAAIKVCNQLSEGQRCVVVLPDSSRNYLNKFLNNDWMVLHGHLPIETSQNFSGRAEFWGDLLLWNFEIEVKKALMTDLMVVRNDILLRDLIKQMAAERHSHALVTDEKDVLCGVVSLSAVAKRVSSMKHSLDTKVAEVVTKASLMFVLEDASMSTAASLLSVMNTASEVDDPCVLVVPEIPDVEDQARGYSNSLQLQNPLGKVSGALHNQVVARIISTHRCQ